MKTLSLAAITLSLIISVALFVYGGQPHSKAAQTSENVPAKKQTSSRQKQDRPTRVREVYAVWYDVPPGSLAKRRARFDEMTAAHNRLPLGTLVRVTNARNGKSVLVRITDRGVPRGRATIDLCREAAQHLDIISRGIARVRLEVLPDAPQINAAEPARVTAH